MTILWFRLLTLVVCLALPLLSYAVEVQKSVASPNSVNATVKIGDYEYPVVILGNADGTVNSPKVTIEGLTITLACEDVTNGICRTEERYSNLPTGATTAMFAADTAIKNAPGYVKAITCYSDATATAGTIALLDNTAAGAGNTLWSFDVLAVAYNTPFTVELQTPFSVGLYADFTTTADVKCMVRYR